MINTKFPTWPLFTKEEAEAVSSVLLSNKVNYSTGKECFNFEKEFVHLYGTKYSVDLSNGTYNRCACLNK
jgi:dTDP-4-amino-4,6-dideoxygalactose transaminase